MTAENVGLPTPPPYLSDSNKNNVFLQGVSFASGGAGILNSTNDHPYVRTYLFIFILFYTMTLLLEDFKFSLIDYNFFKLLR